MNERKARALLERHFVDPLPPAQLETLLAHVRGCAGCKAHYDKLFAFEERIDGGKAEVERIGESLFARLQPEKKAGLFGALAFTWPFPRVAALAAGMVLMVAITVQLVHTTRDAPKEFLARSSAPGQLDPELLATCFRDVEGKIQDVQHLDGNTSIATCSRGGRLAFAYRNARAGDQLVLFARRGAEVTRLLGPTGLVVKAGQQPLGGAFAIDPDAPAGEVTLLAVFGASLDPGRLEAALKAGQDPKEAAGEGAVVRTLSYRLAR